MDTFRPNRIAAVSLIIACKMTHNFISTNSKLYPRDRPDKKGATVMHESNELNMLRRRIQKLMQQSHMGLH